MGHINGYILGAVRTVPLLTFAPSPIISRVSSFSISSISWRFSVEPKTSARDFHVATVRMTVVILAFVGLSRSRAKDPQPLVRYTYDRLINKLTFECRGGFLFHFRKAIATASNLATKIGPSPLDEDLSDCTNFGG